MKLFVAIVGLMLCALPAVVRAQAGPPPFTPNPAQCSSTTPDNCANQPTSSSPAATDTQLVSVSSRTGCDGCRLGQSRSAAGRKKAQLGPIHVAATEGAAGLLAADAQSSPWGLWTSYGKTKFEGTEPTTRYDANLDNVRIGLDRAFSERFVLGAALSFEHLNMNTRFNAGGQDADAYMLTPYMLFVLTEQFSIDVNFGFGRNQVRQSRLDPASAPGSPLTLTSNFDGTRLFGSAALNGSHTLGNLTFGGRLGYLESRERQDSYTEVGGPSALSVAARTLKLGQVFAALDLAYAFTPVFEIYGNVTGRHDTRRGGGNFVSASGTPATIDKQGYDWTVGTRLFSIFGLPRLSGYLEYVNTAARTDLKNHAINLLLRFEL